MVLARGTPARFFAMRQSGGSVARSKLGPYDVSEQVQACLELHRGTLALASQFALHSASSTRLSISPPTTSIAGFQSWSSVGGSCSGGRARSFLDSFSSTSPRGKPFERQSFTASVAEQATRECDSSSQRARVRPTSRSTRRELRPRRRLRHSVLRRLEVAIAALRSMSIGVGGQSWSRRSSPHRTTPWRFKK